MGVLKCPGGDPPFTLFPPGAEGDCKSGAGAEGGLFGGGCALAWGGGLIGGGEALKSAVLFACRAA